MTNNLKNMLAQYIAGKITEETERTTWRTPCRSFYCRQDGKAL